jgi:ABC-type nitrate/sulfonate/bicarbonate transport system substrate-binding protein
MAYMATDYKLNGYNTRVILAAQPTIRKSVLTFVLKDSPYKTAADLKGKTIGTIRYCCGYAAALEIFQKAGYPIDTDLKKGDIRVWIAPGSQNIRDALLSQRIEGAADHLQVTAHTSAYLQGLYRVLDTLPENSIYQQYGGRAYYYGKAEWIDAHPDLAQAYAKMIVKTRNWIFEHRDEAAKIVARDMRIPLGVASFQIANLEWASLAPAEPSWDATVESLKQVQIQYKNLGEPLYLKRTLSDKDLEAFIDKRFFKGGQYSAFN